MSGRRLWHSVSLLLPLSMSACSGSFQRGIDLYAEGRWVEAADVFDHYEYRLTDSDATDRARYGLYRGLTMLALGDLRDSERWLNYATQAERTTPGLLEPSHRYLLDWGWRELERRQRPVVLDAATTSELVTKPPVSENGR